MSHTDQIVSEEILEHSSISKPLPVNAAETELLVSIKEAQCEQTLRLLLLNLGHL